MNSKDRDLRDLLDQMKQSERRILFDFLTPYSPKNDQFASQPEFEAGSSPKEEVPPKN